MNDASGTVRDAGVNENAASEKKKQRNVLPKILCVVAAFVLWLYVMQVESPEYTQKFDSVPVILENVTSLKSDAGLSVYNGNGNVIGVSVSGKKSVISKLTSEDIKAYADVANIKDAGRHSLEVTFDLPDGVTLVESDPTTVPVFVDETSSVSLNVKEKLEKMVISSPYELGKTEFEFDSITVSGPKSKVENLREAQVTVDMDGKSSSFTAKCPIVLLDENGNTADTTYLSLSASEMDVKIPIYVTKEVPVTTEFKYGLLDKKLVSVKTQPETVTVKGDESQFTEGAVIIEPIVIDEKQITGSTYSVKVHPTVNGKLTLDGEDEEVTVNVSLDPSLRTKQFKVSDIEAVNAASGIKYSIVDKSVDVTLRGTSEDLALVKASDISALADLSGFDSESSGTVSKTVSIIIDTEDADSVYEIGEYSVQIKINQ